ncbi:putative B3 domain-containing protein Os03g0621600 isoform X3 [Triticum aestivum]|uniref:putative B3 domain-containing protein Os03g0621600 isoform X3 n=1 Tax=Triticum aestivum TaxID=4565 RepID=UPI001D01C70D|nr:putative B3 domain-containing protein Os03g0621600 isoform X3 [Triticum aestivum]
MTNSPRAVCNSIIFIKGCSCKGAAKRMGISFGSCKLPDEQYYKHLDDEKKYFLVLMLGDFQDSMIIPEEVVRRLKGEIPGEIKLETRNGYGHTIVVAKNQEKLVLTVGWRQFIENYDLQIGDSLMFRYKGNSQFNVMTFDKLGREKALSVVLDPFLHRVQDKRNEAHEIGSSKKMDVPSERCKSRTEYHYANLDDEKKYFLVHMMGDFQQEMIIPEVFVQRFKGEFPREMILETQNCHSYVIGVAKNNGNLVLTVGWGKFVGTFGLEMGDTIVFRYIGNSRFNVIIFDELGCEKAIQTQPFSIGKEMPMESPRLQMETDKSCQDKNTVISTSSCESSGDCFSSEEEYGVREDEEEYGVREVPGSNFTVRKKKVRLSSIQKEQLKDGYITVNKTKLTPAQKEVVKHKVHSIDSEIPIFAAVMRKSNLNSRFNLTFPRHYAKKYLREEPSMCLRRRERKWGVRFGENNGGNKLRIGWKQFVEGNKLKMGDICLFKLLTDERGTMTVFIIRAKFVNYWARLSDADREAAFQRGALAHQADGARAPVSRLLHIAKTEAMEDDVVAPECLIAEAKIWRGVG